MKKISFILALAIAGTASAFAQANQPEHTNNLNPYAYGVKAEVEDGMMAITYQLNAPATAVSIAIYKDGEFVRAQESTGLSVGLQNEVIDFTEEPAGTYTVGIRVSGTSVEAPTQLGKTDGTEFTPTFYTFWHPKGVVVDTNPYSPNFGRIITDEGMADVVDQAADNYWDYEGPGLYAFDASFAPITNGNSRRFAGTGTTFPDKTQIYANAGQYGPNRLALTKDGSRLFVSQTEIGTGLVNIYEVSADLQTWTPFVSTPAPLGEATVGNIGITVRGDGADATVISLEGTADGRYTSTAYADNLIIREYNGTTATDLFAGEAIAALLTADDPDLAGTNFYLEQSQLSTSEDGFWISTGRGAGAQLIHVNAQGVRDYIGAGNFAGGGACLEHNGKLYVSRPSANVAIMAIGRDANGLTLTEEGTFHLDAIGGALNNFAIDYANNFYACGNYGEKLVAAMLPYEGMVETPVDAEIVVEAAAIENVEAIAPVQKVVENGQVVIIKNGVRYNALGIQL